MAYRLINSVEQVQVFSPTLISYGKLCTIQSAPSGSILLRTVPDAEFAADAGQGILSSLSDAVEQLISGGRVIAAEGVQTLQPSGLLEDDVRVTVLYTPTDPIPGQITSQIDIPVDVLTADTSFGSFLSGGSAQDRIDAEVARLAAMATG